MSEKRRAEACEAALTDAGYLTGMCKMAFKDGWTAAVASERERIFDAIDVACEANGVGIDVRSRVRAAIRGDQ